MLERGKSSCEETDWFREQPLATDVLHGVTKYRYTVVNDPATQSDRSGDRLVSLATASLARRRFALGGGPLMPALFAYLIAVGLLLGGGYGALNWLAAPEPVKVAARSKPPSPPRRLTIPNQPPGRPRRRNRANPRSAIRPAQTTRPRQPISFPRRRPRRTLRKTQGQRVRGRPRINRTDRLTPR